MVFLDADEAVQGGKSRPTGASAGSEDAVVVVGVAHLVAAWQVVGVGAGDGTRLLVITAPENGTAREAALVAAFFLRQCWRIRSASQGPFRPRDWPPSAAMSECVWAGPARCGFSCLPCNTGHFRLCIQVESDHDTYSDYPCQPVASAS